ncbi:uncharacterized protein LOC144763893 isoform X3 [Lissotriton helveticus]
MELESGWNESASRKMAVAGSSNEVLRTIFHKIASFQRQPTVFKSAMNILRKPVPPDLQHLFKNPDGPIVQLGMSFQAYILQPLTLTGLMVGNGQLSGTLGQDLRQLSQTTDMQMNTLLWDKLLEEGQKGPKCIGAGVQRNVYSYELYEYYENV